MLSKQLALDIVLPAYNPVDDWTDRILKSYKEISVRLEGVSIHIILVNDGSKRGISTEDIRCLQEGLPHFSYVNSVVNEGKGAALRKGIAISTSPICIFTDIDFPYTIDSLIGIYGMLNNGEVDIAIGIKDQQYYEHLPPFRIKVSRFLRFLARSFLRISITDTQCGLKGFNQEGKKVFLQTSIKRYLADLEFIFLAERNKKLRMNPLQVSLRSGVVFSKVNMKILIREGINFLGVLGRSLFTRFST